MSDQDKPISEASIDDLVNALRTRCPAFIFGYLSPDDGDCCETIVAHHGPRMSVSGLAHLCVRVSDSLTKLSRRK